MQFDALRDPARIAQRRAELQDEWGERHSAYGTIVRYVMPVIPTIGPKIRASAIGSAHRQRYFDIYYYVQTKDRHIRHLIPAPEYYKFALDAIGDERYSLELSTTRIAGVMAGIQQQWTATRETLPRTSQPSFWVADHVYRLKAEIASMLFFARSLLDMFSTLSHFLYDPNSRLFNSFADFVKHIAKHDAVSPSDPAMAKYVNTQLDWFWALRDFRDFVTHHSSMRVDFYERDGALDTYLQHVVRPGDLVRDTIAGIDALLAFADDHYAPRFDQRAPT